MAKQTKKKYYCTGCGKEFYGAAPFVWSPKQDPNDPYAIYLSKYEFCSRKCSRDYAQRRKKNGNFDPFY